MDTTYYHWYNCCKKVIFEKVMDISKERLCVLVFVVYIPSFIFLFNPIGPIFFATIIGDSTLYYSLIYRARVILVVIGI